MEQNQQWYFAEGEQQVGPVSWEDLQEAVQSGRIQAQTLVWSAHLENWMPCAELTELRSLPQTPPGIITIKSDSIQPAEITQPKVGRPKGDLLKLLGIASVIILMVSVWAIKSSNGKTESPIETKNIFEKPFDFSKITSNFNIKRLDLADRWNMARADMAADMLRRLVASPDFSGDIDSARNSIQEALNLFIPDSDLYSSDLKPNFSTFFNGHGIAIVNLGYSIDNNGFVNTFSVTLIKSFARGLTSKQYQMLQVNRNIAIKIFLKMMENDIDFTDSHQFDESDFWTKIAQAGHTKFKFRGNDITVRSNDLLTVVTFSR